MSLQRFNEDYSRPIIRSYVLLGSCKMAGATPNQHREPPPPMAWPAKLQIKSTNRLGNICAIYGHTGMQVTDVVLVRRQCQTDHKRPGKFSSAPETCMGLAHITTSQYQLNYLPHLFTARWSLQPKNLQIMSSSALSASSMEVSRMFSKHNGEWLYNRSWCCQCSAWHTSTDLQASKCAACAHRNCGDCDVEIIRDGVWVRMRRLECKEIFAIG